MAPGDGSPHSSTPCGRPRRIVVISPHLDDAILSLGAAIHGAARRGASVEVLTVFAGDVGSPCPAGDWDSASGFGTAGEAAAARRREDLSACRSIGAHPAWLSFGDEQYPRGGDALAVLAAISRQVAGAELVLVPGFPLHHRTTSGWRARSPASTSARRRSRPTSNNPMRRSPRRGERMAASGWRSPPGALAPGEAGRMPGVSLTTPGAPPGDAARHRRLRAATRRRSDPLPVRKPCLVHGDGGRGLGGSGRAGDRHGTGALTRPARRQPGLCLRSRGARHAAGRSEYAAGTPVRRRVSPLSQVGIAAAMLAAPNLLLCWESNESHSWNPVLAALLRSAGLGVTEVATTWHRSLRSTCASSTSACLAFAWEPRT